MSRSCGRRNNDMKIKLRKNKPVVRNTKVEDYICINGKKLSEQTIYDYAPFIPSWDEREKLKEDSYLVRCVFPHNHLHNDDNFSMVISKGHTRNVVITCRSGCCDNFQILQYFLSRLTGEVKTDTVPTSVKQVSRRELTLDDFVGNEHLPMGMSKEKQWKVHQEIVAHRKKYENQKPWKKLSEEEKDELLKEQIKRSKYIEHQPYRRSR